MSENQGNNQNSQANNWDNMIPQSNPAVSNFGQVPQGQSNDNATSADMQQASNVQDQNFVIPENATTAVPISTPPVQQSEPQVASQTYNSSDNTSANSPKTVIAKSSMMSWIIFGMIAIIIIAATGYYVMFMGSGNILEQLGLVKKSEVIVAPTAPEIPAATEPPAAPTQPVVVEDPRKVEGDLNKIDISKLYDYKDSNIK